MQKYRRNGSYIVDHLIVPLVVCGMIFFAPILIPIYTRREWLIPLAIGLALGALIPAAWIL